MRWARHDCVELPKRAACPAASLGGHVQTCVNLGQSQRPGGAAGPQGGLAVAANLGRTVFSKTEAAWQCRRALGSGILAPESVPPAEGKGSRCWGREDKGSVWPRAGLWLGHTPAASPAKQGDGSAHRGPLRSQRAAWHPEHIWGRSPRTPGGTICLPGDAVVTETALCLLRKRWPCPSQAQGRPWPG